MSDRLIEADVVATEVSFEAYLEKYAHDFYEWVGGNVIQMSPIHMQHDAIMHFVHDLFAQYFRLRKNGRVLTEPFTMHLPALEVARQPDVQVILDENPHEFTPTLMKGPADLVVEVVSPESGKRDYEIKRAEYEAGGVREYWIIDPLKQACLFLVRGEDGKYVEHRAAEDGTYLSAVMDRFKLPIGPLWLDKNDMPDGAEMKAIAERMLSEDDE